MRPIVLGIVSSLFFAVTFVLNQKMSATGGSWIWSASLRYLFMFPMLYGIVLYRGTLQTVFRELRSHLWLWMVWSVVGFGFFYIPLCIASAYAPAWMVAGSWQFTIIAGSLLAPFFYERTATPSGMQRMRKKLPVRGLMTSSIIFAGILVMELDRAGITSANDIYLGVWPVVLAAFAYPLGNRKMMELCDGRIGAIERVFGMTLASLPLWILLSIYGVFAVGWPPVSQVVQSAIVALLSGVIATVLFFSATDMTQGNVHKLAAVEATQSGEVLFALLLSFLFISNQAPTVASLIGMILIMVGMVLHSLSPRIL